MDNQKYTVLLVDDEEDVITVIRKKIDWESLGFVVIGHAHDGMEALEIAEQKQPDVVMTDIKMPHMDGLELAARLKEIYPLIRIIIFSGFDEFEYAKEAIRLEAEEYLLKPVDKNELKEVFTRVKDALDQERADKRNVEKLQNYYLESLPLLQENFYASMMEGNIPADDIARYMADYRIELKAPFYTVVVFHTPSTSVSEEISPVLMAVSVRRLAEEKIGSAWKSVYFSYLRNTVAIVALSDEHQLIALIDDCERFTRIAKQICGALVTVGVGQPVSKFADVARSYSGAREAVSYRAIYGSGRAISISEITPREHVKTTAPDEHDMHEIFRAIKMDAGEELTRAVATYMERTFTKGLTLQQYQLRVWDLLGKIYMFAENNEMAVDSVFDGKTIDSLKQTDRDELGKWLYNTTEKMRQVLCDQRKNTHKSVIDKALEYIRDNYADPNLTVDFMCERLGLSGAYFSTLFKKETGKTFVSYLTDYRLDKAIRLLVEKNEKSYVIAQQIGYQDPNYFSYVFKKKYGVSPSKYKQSLT